MEGNWKLEDLSDAERKVMEEIMNEPHACSDLMVLANCVDEQEARDYIAKYKLKAHYRKELKDGTPRRIWELYDPSGNSAGRLYTAIGPRGVKNVDDPWEDLFDFAEIMADRAEWVKATSKTARLKIKPHTKHFKEDK